MLPSVYLATAVEIDTRTIDERDFAVVTKLRSDCFRVIILGQAKLLKSRDGDLVDNLDDVRLTLCSLHALVRGRDVFVHGHLVAVALAICPQHVGQIKLDRVTGTVFSQDDSVSILNFAADRRNADADFRTGAHSAEPIPMLHNLHLGKASGHREQTKHEDREGNDEAVDRQWFLNRGGAGHGGEMMKVPRAIAIRPWADALAPSSTSQRGWR